MSAEDRRRGRRRLSEEERTLWRDVTRSVAPLARLRRLRETPPSEPVSLQTTPAGPQSKAPKRLPPQPVVVPRPKPSPGLAPIERKQKKRLARGSLPIDARLDLHGCSQHEAHAALLHFLRRAQGQGAAFVLVITGKGRADHDGFREVGVLKRQVPLWLAMPEFRGFVVGFEDAAVGHGGAGALYVRLRRAR
jgi:DNA-nicking Smr family endonuclease